MRKVLVVGAREYGAAVRSKSFLISLLLMPVLMGASVGVQIVVKKQSDTEDKKFAVVDRTGGEVFKRLEQAAEEHNKKAVDPETGRQTGARFILEKVPPSPDSPEAIAQQRLELSNRARNDEIWGFLDIDQDLSRNLGKALKKGEIDALGKKDYVRFQTSHPTYEKFPAWVQQQMFMAATGIQSGGFAEKLGEALTVAREGLSQRDRATGQITEPDVINQLARFIVPAALVALMFMIIMLSSTPSMHGVVEEKMQRIAEVLLGSLPPFHLMMGKLLGLMGISLTVAAVYLGGVYWAAWQYGFAGFLSVPVLLWYILFQVLAVVMYGSLFLAIGAAATDIKETQTLVMPVILLACIPMFVLGIAIEDPNRPLVVGASFFPPVTPMLMMARVAVPPGPPLWQPALATLLVLLVTLVCVYAAGRIFRVGILMQGKGAKIGQLVQWVIRG